jgi:hypothetical protein
MKGIWVLEIVIWVAPLPLWLIVWRLTTVQESFSGLKFTTPDQVIILKGFTLTTLLAKGCFVWVVSVKDNESKLLTIFTLLEFVSDIWIFENGVKLSDEYSR